MKNKKMIFGFLAVLAIAAMAAWNVSFGSKTDRLSDIALANVEALAENEGGDGDEDCSDGIPRLNCQIWTVSYEFSGDNWSCTTGGSYRCAMGV